MKPRALDWFALAGVGLHPTKIAILEHLAEHGQVESLQSAQGVAPGELEQVPRVRATLKVGGRSSLGSVSYHVRELREKNLVVLRRTEPRRGALQHFYVLTELGVITPRQEARRRLERSASKLSGSEEALTPEWLARAMQVAAMQVDKVHARSWDELGDFDRRRLVAISAVLLEGVAGA